MAARSTRVTVRNQTNATLHHIDDLLEHGVWTDPLSPPAEIKPGATMWWQSESDGLATGTEGHARYAVVGSNDIVTFHWDNPFVGANFYEQSVTGPFGIYFSGGTGNNSEATYSLISNTRVAVPGYLPSIHGFAFANHWPAEHITSITLPDPFGDILIGNAAWGLCGGMSFASRDYFESGMWAPQQTTNPTGEGDPLFDYIVRRLAQSLNVGDVADFMKYADPIYPNTDDPTLGNGRDWVMAHVAFPGIRDVIDSGHPCPIGLVLKQLPTLTGMGHQVCVYAYQLTGQQLVLWVYDPNSPGNDAITMKMDISRTDQALIDVNGTVNVPEHPICFFTQSYEQRDPVQPRRQAAAMDVFWVGPDGAIGTTWENPHVDNGAWHPPFAISPPGAACADSSLAAVTRYSGAMDVFWNGPDGAVGTTWENPQIENGAWHPPFPISQSGAARTSSPLAAVNRYTGAMDVFWIGSDGAIGTTWENPQIGNGTWHPPFPISPTGAARADSSLAVVTR